ncbi:MAG TPA: RNA polymerase sigma factor [Prosthecobacter sp.]|nr:RNA polymerase sigma factor [Prosthecobacter sp.]
MAAAAFSWKQCFDQVAPNLLLYARQIAPTPADAEDVVQMAFVRWWRRFPDGDSAHIPLLYAAVRTIALDMRRSSQRRTVREARSDIALPHGDSPIFDPPAEQKETAALVEQALAKLPEEQREVVTLRLWGGLTFAEIAQATGSSLNTVAGRYRYALAALQKHLAPLKDDLSPASQPLPLNLLQLPNKTEVLS